MSRTPTQLRPLSAQNAVLARADGSASFAFGTLSAYASTTGPLESRIRDELIDRAALQINITPLTGLPTISSRGLGQGLRELFESVVLLHLHPRSVVQVNVQLVTGPPGFVPPSRTSVTSDAILIGDDDDDEEQEGGGGGGKSTAIRKLRPSAPHPNSTFSASQRATIINAAMLALLDSGLAMQATVAACACAVLPAKEASRLRKRRRRSDDGGDVDTQMDAEGSHAEHVLVLDPSPEEEYYATSTHVFAFGFAGKSTPPAREWSHDEESYDIADLAPAAGDGRRNADEEEEILYAESHGPVGLETYADAADQCRRAARGLIVPFYRRWLSQHHAKQ
ncbi:unnamed protein product [Tilletia laevis]|uniref:Exoribonuclease phosphorolytic domain-containing protein n=2 Tax=Tilletia TaxID=13289 RepID=A0A177V548_9BASI|nr:hypothetical protein CF336_g572 [Tilletia laevis]KAE8265324.1 hypothetical protein A4X03_0g343 [Tilletia caries]KAE8208639.1 hypothetical protein CF335_g268 [Tilletia laevis]CAD6890359.1 unnamed protein product [Tilletia caries]CAD6913337.1 unnamed protein product [Tilletia caries]